jgi:hypothetical protein
MREVREQGYREKVSKEREIEKERERKKFEER